MNKPELFDIIVVEDDTDLGAMIQILLERMKYTVKRFEHPDKFLAFIENNDTRLIIMDMLLSGGNGCELCEALKKNPNKKHIKIIMISAHPDARKSCFEAGTDAFIEKPFDIGFFMQQVKTHAA